MSGRREKIGFAWNDIFGGAHLAGKAVLSAFGAGAIAQPIEQLESPILPDWAKSQPSGTLAITTQAPNASSTSQSMPSTLSVHVVHKIDYVIVIHADHSQPSVVIQPDVVGVSGGRLFQAPPDRQYRTVADLGNKFTFGYDAPTAVDVVFQGKKTSFPSPKQVLFCKGSVVDGNQPIAGDIMGIIGTILGALGIGQEEDVEEYDAHWNEILGARKPQPAPPWNPQRVDRVDPYTRVGAIPNYGAGPHGSGTGDDIVGDGYHLSDRERKDLLRTVMGTGAADYWDTVGTGAADYWDTVGTGAADYWDIVGTGAADYWEVLGAKKKERPAGGDRNPHSYKRGEYVFGIGMAHLDYTVGVVPASRYTAGAHALATPGARVIPAKQPTLGFTIKTTPKGRQFTSLQVNHRAHATPKQTIRTARAVAKRAQDAGQRALGVIAKAHTAATQKSKKSVVGLFGKAPPAAGLAALAQHATNLVSAGKGLSTHADKYEKVVSSDAVKAKARAVAAKKSTHLIGGYGEWQEIVSADWQTILGNDIDLAEESLCTVLGAADAPVPDPTHPGFLTDGSPDPNAGGAGAGSPSADTGGGGGAGAPGSATSAVPGPPNYGAGTPPTVAGGIITMPDGSTWPQAGVDYAPDPNPQGDDQTDWSSQPLPLGAIMFDGSHPMSMMGANKPGVGSYSVFFGTVPGSTPKGGPNSGYELHDDGWWLHLYGTQPSVNYNGAENFDHLGDIQTWMIAESIKNGWGPFIGSPSGWEKGLRFTTQGPSGPGWFWFFDMAPDWAKAAMLQSKLNDAITQFKAAVVAGQTDYVNAQLQDKLSAQQAATQAQAQAATDAQVNQQSEVANAQSAITQQQQSDQASALALQQQQQMQRMAAAQAQLQQQAQAAQLAYFQAHPEAMFTPADQGGGGGAAPAADQGGGGDTAYPEQDIPSNINWDNQTSSRSTDDLAQQITDGTSPSADDLAQEAGDLFPGA